MAGNPQTQTFTYDELDRLTSGAASGGTGGTYALQNYTNNGTTGNLSSKAGVNYTYDDGLHKHAVTRMGTDTFTYDANGNQITRSVGGNSYALSYDAENRLVGVSGAATASFVYDGDGNRVKGTIGGVTTTYIGNYFEWTGSTSSMKKYYYAGSTRVAMRTGSNTLEYLLGDHLGSQSITTDNNGLNPKEIRYYPWGTERYTSGTTPTTFHFTGQRLESSIGLYYYGARWYDPAVGRFVQADSIVPIPSINTKDIKQILFSLIVDYHEISLLSQLNKMHRDELIENARKNEELTNKKQILELEPENKDPYQGDFDEDKNQTLENLNPIKINNLSDIGKIPTNKKQEEKNQESQYEAPINMEPYQLNSMGLDRFAYVSNCPTMYTDPSGHCDFKNLGLGIFFDVAGLFEAGIGVAVVLAVSAEIIDPPTSFLGILEAPVAYSWGIIHIGVGFASIFKGGDLIYKSGCIPGTSTQ